MQKFSLFAYITCVPGKGREGGGGACFFTNISYVVMCGILEPLCLEIGYTFLTFGLKLCIVFERHRVDVDDCGF